MSEVAQQPADPYGVGWWIESADEEVYGPVSRSALRKFLEEGVISTNTLVRHCTESDAAPVADQPGMTDGLQLSESAATYGDKLAEAWTGTRRERRELAEGNLPCYRHKRPAVLVCVRCHGPYCNRCRAKPFRRHFFFCRRCQASLYNRRAGAYLIDWFLSSVLPLAVLVPIAEIAAEGGVVLVNLARFALLAAFVFRDALFWGAGPGKRVLGLKVVRTKDGAAALGYGQAVVRFLSQMIPIFNLIDILVPYRDPLGRRFGDRWANTRVIDSGNRLDKVRRKVRGRLVRKGVTLAEPVGMTMAQYAQIGG